MNTNDNTPTALNREGNRQPSGQAAPDLARHARKCIICHHPNREAIDGEFIHWLHPDNIVDEYELPSRSALYRHAHATGLYELRRRNLRYSLEHVIQEAERTTPTADGIIRAVRAYSRVTTDGRWIEPAQRIVVIRRPAPAPVLTSSDQPLLPPAQLVTRHLSLTTASLIGTPKQLEIAATDTKQTSGPDSNRDKNTTPSERD